VNKRDSPEKTIYMLPKIDKRDRRLLLELDRNCRRPLKDLAKIVGGAIETTRYRIERLQTLGVIKNFLTVIDGGRVNFYYYKVFLKLYNVSEKEINKIIQDLVDDPRICWVVRVDGSFDIGFTPRVQNPREQSEIFDKFRRKYAKHIKRWTLSVNLHMDFFARDYLVSESRRSNPLGSYSSDKPTFVLDRSGDLVLTELAKAPRSSARSISDRTGLSIEVVLNRIKTFEKEKVIVRYSLVTNTDILQHVNFYVLIYLNHINAEREQAFLRSCQSQPNIVYMIKSLGEWDYELSIEAPTVAKYREVMMTLSREFSDIIQEYNGMMVERLAKYVYP
jgi:DNA-binding Lrp family transcriptional regulator